MDLVETIGFRGPEITLFINVVTLLNQPKYLGSFAIFYVVEYHLVGLLKTSFKEVRPIGYLDAEFADGGDYTGLSTYGMPSGHSSLSWYSTIFLWLVKKSPYLMILESAICFITMYQRWKWRKHTIEQLVAGVFVGGSVAWFAAEFTKRIYA